MRGNPIREFLPDDYYYELKSKGFLNERAIRDYYLKKRFHFLHSNRSSCEIFSILQREFPYLSEDTIRKIIYSKNKTDFEPGIEPEDNGQSKCPHFVLGET